VWQAGDLGIRGVPFFVVDRLYGMSGAQSAEQLLEVLQRAWTEERPLTFVGSAENPALVARTLHDLTAQPPTQRTSYEDKTNCRSRGRCHRPGWHAHVDRGAAG